ncbi:NADH:ubiquinone oxidoreductase 6.6kD subunit [Microthyrium microscopicum]|uniref:NADH dehydrogenase [ubiquinone] 1 beta subcomplex subunit 4 n=1 Tax=Microthyrium microscopicum TaxID=703497 RepID=A0A6A6UKT4_9PEZI|nr:NADH:ubiquinone oxidoreductase 6.6kD subunit [Microthyrium microscopicum]
MAGGHGPQVVNMDPALLKWYNMSANRYKYFKWTPRTARISLVYVAIIPAAFLYVGLQTDGKYEFRGKLRGNPIVEY